MTEQLIQSVPESRDEFDAISSGSVSEFLSVGHDFFKSTDCNDKLASEYNVAGEAPVYGPENLSSLYGDVLKLVRPDVLGLHLNSNQIDVIRGMLHFPSVESWYQATLIVATYLNSLATMRDQTVPSVQNETRKDIGLS